MELSRTFQTRAQALEVYRSQLCRQLLFIEVFEAVRPDTPIKLTLRISETNSVIKLAAKAIKMIRKSEAIELGYGTRAGVILDVPITPDIVAPFRAFFLSDTGGNSQASPAASGTSSTHQVSQSSRVKVSYSSDVSTAYSQNPKISFSSSQGGNSIQSANYGASQSGTRMNNGHSRFGIVSPELLAQSAQRASNPNVEHTSSQYSRLNAVPRDVSSSSEAKAVVRDSASSQYSRLNSVPRESDNPSYSSQLQAVPREPVSSHYSRLNAPPREPTPPSYSSQLHAVPREPVAKKTSASGYQSVASIFDDLEDEVIVVSPTGEAVSQVNHDHPADEPQIDLYAVSGEVSHDKQSGRSSSASFEPGRRVTAPVNTDIAAQKMADVTPVPQRKPVERLDEISSDAKRMTFPQEPIVPKSATTIQRENVALRTTSEATPVPVQRKAFEGLSEIAADEKRYSASDVKEPPKSATTLQRESVSPLANIEFDDELGLPDPEDAVAGIMPTKKASNDSKMIKLTLNDAFDPNDFEISDIEFEKEESKKHTADSALHAMDGFIFDDETDDLADIEIADDFDFSVNDADLIDINQANDASMIELDASDFVLSDDEPQKNKVAESVEMGGHASDSQDDQGGRVKTVGDIAHRNANSRSNHFFSATAQLERNTLQEATPAAPMKISAVLAAHEHDEQGGFDSPQAASSQGRHADDDSRQISLKNQSELISSLNNLARAERQSFAPEVEPKLLKNVANDAIRNLNEDVLQLNNDQTGKAAGRSPLGDIRNMSEEQVIRALDKSEGIAERGSIFALFKLMPTASQEEIRSVYNDTVRTLHPDCYDHACFSEKTIQRLEDAYQRFNEANQIIQHPVRRKLYIEASRLEGCRGGMPLKQYKKWIETYQQKNAVNIRMANSLVEQVRESQENGLLSEAAQQLKLALQYDPFNFEAHVIELEKQDDLN